MSFPKVVLMVFDVVPPESLWLAKISAPESCVEAATKEPVVV